MKSQECEKGYYIFMKMCIFTKNINFKIKSCIAKETYLS